MQRVTDRKSRRAIANLLIDRKGSVLTVVAATFPLLLLGAGIAVDSAQIALWKRQLQRSADSSAIAGAFAKSEGDDVSAAVTRDLELNNEVTLSEAATVQSPPTSGPAIGLGAVRVGLVAQPNLAFGKMFGVQRADIRVWATASATPDPKYCLLALEDGTATGVVFTGDAAVNLGCGVATNSRSTTAITAEGSSTVRVSDLYAVGNITVSSNFQGTPDVYQDKAPQPDPYAGLPDPSTAPCSPATQVNPNQTRTLSPGCFRGLDLLGNVTLNPGTYVINGDGLRIGAGAQVHGEGVTFVLTGTGGGNVATLTIDGNALVNLSAPESGAYAGVLFFQTRNASAGSTANVITGNSASSFAGAFYFPKQAVEFKGNASMNTQCLRIVALRIKMTGNSSGTNACTQRPSNRLFGNRVRLIA